MAKTTTSNVDQSAIPRPLNCFLLYRLEKQKEIVAKCAGANHRDISKIIAKWWSEASEAEKKPFRERARIAKMEHRKLYPDYKYTPKKKTAPKRSYVRKNKKEQFTSRAKENNRFMEMIYDDSNALDLLEEDNAPVNIKINKPVKKNSKSVNKQINKTVPMENFFEEYKQFEFENVSKLSCRYATSVSSPDFSSQSTSPFTEAYSDSDFPSPTYSAQYSPYDTNNMSYSMNLIESISPFSVLDTPYISDFNAYPTMPYTNSVDYFHFDHTINNDNSYNNNNNKFNQDFSWTECPNYCSTEQYQTTFNMLQETEQLQYINPALLHM